MFEEDFVDPGKLLEAASRITPQWLAGFFDGEGCVSARYRDGGCAINVDLTQKDPTILVLVNIAFPGGSLDTVRSVSPRSPKVCVCHRLAWRGRSCIKILTILKDYVICKKVQVEAGLELARLTSYSGIRLPDGIAARRRELADIISGANHHYYRAEEEKAKENKP